MNAQAYLISHGWSGPGNPLNPDRRPSPHGGLGLTRPILVARKQNKGGIGKKTTKDPTNQWWLRGFEEVLRGVAQDGSATPSDSPDSNSLAKGKSELYKFFVRGEALPGTLEKMKTAATPATATTAVTVSTMPDSDSTSTTREKKKKEKKKSKENKERRRMRNNNDSSEEKTTEGKDRKRKKRKLEELKDGHIKESEKDERKKARRKGKKTKVEDKSAMDIDVDTGIKDNIDEHLERDDDELKKPKDRDREEQKEAKEKKKKKKKKSKKKEGHAL